MPSHATIDVDTYPPLGAPRADTPRLLARAPLLRVDQPPRPRPRLPHVRSGWGTKHVHGRLHPLHPSAHTILPQRTILANRAIPHLGSEYPPPSRRVWQRHM